MGGFMSLDLLIFDFDGVLSNSEYLSSLSLVETLGKLGLDLTLEEAERRFSGMGSQQMVTSLQQQDGLIVPEDFQAQNWAIVQRLMREQLQPVRHVPEMLAALPPDLPICIASNSFKEWIDFALEIMGLGHYFDESVRFNADMVSRGKPAPDLHLHVLAEMGGIDPKRALVIEDTLTGLGGGIAAGIEVWGCTAVIPHPEQRAQALLAAGATRVFNDLRLLPAFVEERRQGLGSARHALISAHDR